MKRLLILCLLIVASASARVFRTTKSGVWSDSTVWASTVPYPNADGDTVTIAATHSCSLNVDLSGISTGFGKLADSGTLFLRSQTGIKVANNIIGNGRFRVGDSVTSVCSVNVYINGNYSNRITDAQYWGKERTGILTGYLTNAYSAGATKLHLDRNMDIRVGDVVTISDSSTVGQVAGETGLTWGSTNYRVAAYDSTTDTLTLTDALLATRHIGDFVAVLPREIWIHQSGTAATNRYNYDLDKQVYQNVWLNGWDAGAIGGDTSRLISCAGSNNTNGGVCYYGTNHTLSGTFTTSNNTNGGVCYGGTNHTLSGTFTTSNNTNGGVCYYCTNHTLSGTFTTSNNTNGGVCYVGTNYTLSGTFSGNETYQLNIGNYAVSGDWTGNKVFIAYRSTSWYGQPWIQTPWLDYDSPRRHRVFAYAGQITTAADLGSIVFNLEDVTYPLILDFPLIASTSTWSFRQIIQKSVSMAVLPMVQLLDPARDPLKVAAGGVVYAADTMTNSIATDETLYITASGLTVGQRYTLRLFAQNASGTVTWYGRDIAEAGTGLLSSKSGSFFYLFR